MPEPISTQVIPRDRHAAFFAALGVIASASSGSRPRSAICSAPRSARSPSRFGAGQKGSSAMPHKRNPVLAENLTGLARLVRAAVTPALENVALWHERDISHSSVERVIGPDTTIALDFALHRLTGLIDGLVVDAVRMRANLDSSQGLIHSQQVLLALTEAGLDRQAAYGIVQRHAMRAWQDRRPLLDLLAGDPEVTAHLGQGELAALFDLDHHVKEVDRIFERVFGADAAR